MFSSGNLNPLFQSRSGSLRGEPARYVVVRPPWQVSRAAILVSPHRISPHAVSGKCCLPGTEICRSVSSVANFIAGFHEDGAETLGKAVRRQLPKGSARVVGVDETWVKVRGRSRPVGVVLDLGGTVLNIKLTGRGFDYRGWFKSMADELGVEVVVTDDSTDYSVCVDETGLSRQQCLVHMKRTLSRAKAKLRGSIRDRYGGLLEQITRIVRELPPDGADRLLRWSSDGGLPPELRWLVVHLLERWRQMTLHQQQPSVPSSTNWLEGRFGRIKPRYRTTRGLKTDSGAANFMAVVCDVLA